MYVAERRTVYADARSCIKKRKRKVSIDSRNKQKGKKKTVNKQVKETAEITLCLDNLCACVLFLSFSKRQEVNLFIIE